MNLNKTLLVEQGQAMIAEAIDLSLPLIMTTFKIGKGTVNTEAEALLLTDIVSYHRDVAILSHSQSANIYKASCMYDNQVEVADTIITELGLYAKVGDTGVEKLFAYATYEPGDYLPVFGDNIITEYNKSMNVGITEGVSVQFIIPNEFDITTKTSLGIMMVGNGMTVDQFGEVAVVSANDGIIVNDSNIQLGTVDNLTTASATKPLSANQGKVLQDTKANKSILINAGSGLVGGGALSGDVTLNIASANDGITVNADNINLNVVNALTSTSTTQPLSANMGKALNENKYDKAEADSRFVNTAGDTVSGAINYPNNLLVLNGYALAIV